MQWQKEKRQTMQWQKEKGDNAMAKRKRTKDKT
jgi:hypothetical protein